MLTVLAGSAFTAFGTAPLSGTLGALPDAAPPVVTTVHEVITLPELPNQLAEADTQPLRLYRNELTRNSDTVDSLLNRMGAQDLATAEFLRNDPIASTVLQGRAGKSVSAIIDNGVLQGTLVVQTRETRRFTDDDTEILAAVAAQVAPLVSEARSVDRFIAPTQEKLWTLARNLWWSWDQEAGSLFRDLDPAR